MVKGGIEIALIRNFEDGREPDVSGGKTIRESQIPYSLNFDDKNGYFRPRNAYS